MLKRPEAARAGDRLRHHRGILAEHAAGIERDVKLAAAFLLDLGRRLLRADHHWMPIGKGGTIFVAEFGGVGRPMQNRRRSKRSSGGDRGARQQCAAAHRHFLHALWSAITLEPSRPLAASQAFRGIWPKDFHE
jgi:hypothetical protein